MIDSHVHLDDLRYADNQDEIVSEYLQQGVQLVINNSCDYNSMLQGVQLAQKYASVYCTVGMHPHDAKSYDQTFEQKMVELAQLPKTVAVGEIGLDYHYDLSERAQQRDVFARQIVLADTLHLPITLHIRAAYGDAADILEAHKNYLNKGVLWHCYSGSAEFARQYAKQGHYFAFGGAITFKNAKKEEVLQAIPLTQVLCETDCPYMTPVPLRGQLNYPQYVKYVIQKMADVYQISFEQMDKQLQDNCFAFFKKIKLHQQGQTI